MTKTQQNRPASRSSGAIRIVGGRWRRTAIEVIDAPGLRPTTDRVRETLFNWLAHAFGGDIEGRTALDLFAGTGALGFEAASRGADSVTLVEANAIVSRGLTALRDRLAADQITVRAGDALRIAGEYRDAGRSFDMIFVDPPFNAGWLERVLPLVVPLCAAQGFVYVEAEMLLAEAELTSLGLEIYRSDKAGEVFYHLLQRKKTRSMRRLKHDGCRLPRNV